jgi:hypothetical protein
MVLGVTAGEYGHTTKCNGGARNNSRDVTPGEGGIMDNDNRERDLSGTRGNNTKSITSINQKDEDYQ